MFFSCIFPSGFNHATWLLTDLLMQLMIDSTHHPFLFPPGWCCHLHDLHHGPAHRVCGHGADLQRPAQPQRPRRGRCPDEGLSGCMFCCFFIVATKPTNTFCRAAVRCSKPANPRLLVLLSRPLYFASNEELMSCTGLYSTSKGQVCALKDRTFCNKARGEGQPFA